MATVIGILTALVLLAGVVIFTINAFRPNGAPARKAPAQQQGQAQPAAANPPRNWQRLQSHALTIAVITMLVSILAIKTLLPVLWALLWGDRLLFWWLVFGIGFIVYLRSMRENNAPFPAARRAANVFLTILVIGALAQFARNPYWDEVTLWSVSSAPATQSTTSGAMQFGSLPAEVKAPIICGCETNDGIPPGRHTDKYGKVLVYVNDPKDPLNIDVGACQINMKWQAAIIKRTDLDPYKEVDNRRLAVLILEEQGEWPWNATRDCWQQKLAALTGTQRFETQVVAPPRNEKDEWRDVKVDEGFTLTFRPVDGSKYLAKTGTRISEYNPASSDCLGADGKILDRNQCILEPSSVISFQSVNEKPVVMVIKYQTRVPLN
jgi:hypothetical protein